MKKGILGGTFDPIHIGHMYIAYEALYKLGLDKVIFMPSGNPPHKTNKLVTDASLRFKMVKKAIIKEEAFEISDYEIRKNGLSYTYETLEFFKSEEKDTELYFITGCDCLFDLGYWKNVDRIFNSANLVVFNRPGYSKEAILEQKRKVEEIYKSNIIFLDLLLLEVSSTYIRESIKDSKEVSFFLPEGVKEIIDEVNLYR